MAEPKYVEEFGFLVEAYDDRVEISDSSGGGRTFTLDHFVSADRLRAAIDDFFAPIVEMWSEDIAENIDFESDDELDFDEGDEGA